MHDRLTQERPTGSAPDMIRVENGMLMEVTAICKGGKLIKKDPQADVQTDRFQMDQIYRVPPPEDKTAPPAPGSPHQ